MRSLLRSRTQTFRMRRLFHELCLCYDRDVLFKGGVMGCGLTELVEKLAQAAERRVEAKLMGAVLATYRAGGYHDDR